MSVSQFRATSASLRTLHFIDPRTGEKVRSFDGWAETGGGGSSVETSKYAGAGAAGDKPVVGLTVTTEDINLKGAFPSDEESEVRRFFRNHISWPVEYVDQPLDPATKEPTGAPDLYRGVLKSVTPAAGGRPNTADVAELEVVITVAGEVG